MTDLMLTIGKIVRSLQIMYSPLIKLVIVGVGFSRKSKFLRAQFDFAFRKQ